jgi:oligoendopeptidase F
MFRSRSRGYRSSLATALDSDNIPETVYRNLIEQVHRHLPVLHRYMDLRARALGLDRLGYHDLHCPLAPALDRRYTVAEAGDLVRRSMAPLGKEYAGSLEASFESRWIDWHPTPGKRSGAYSSGGAYDYHPYVLMNFNGDYESVSTLAHEMGHALHSYFSNRTQPHATADYSIFVAEVASTFNEALLNAKMFDEAETGEERLFLVGTYLDQMRATLFRQTMFAEFELLIHEKAESGEALTGDSLNDLYLDLLRTYQGHDRGVMEIPEAYAIEWASVPHFYYNFYVYQYSTGIVAATALSEAVLDGRPGARERYLEFLGAGGSDYPLELLRRAGVDLESPEPYEMTLGAISRQLDRLEELLERP